MNPCCFLWADVLEVHVGCIFHRKFIFRRILCSKLGYPARFVVTTKCFKYNVTKNRSFLPNAPHVISIWHETSVVTSAFKNLFKLGEIRSQNIILSLSFEKKKRLRKRGYIWYKWGESLNQETSPWYKPEINYISEIDICTSSNHWNVQGIVSTKTIKSFRCSRDNGRETI